MSWKALPKEFHPFGSHSVEYEKAAIPSHTGGRKETYSAYFRVVTITLLEGTAPNCLAPKREVKIYAPATEDTTSPT